MSDPRRTEPPPPPLRVLVLCTGNSARSQIAEALLAARGGGRVEAASAGSRPAPRVHPLAVEVLREHGLEWRGRAPRHVADVERERWDLVITVCDDARDACPVLPGAAARAHWGLPDPAAVPAEAEARRAFRATYEELDRRVALLLAPPAAGTPLDAATLAGRAESLAHTGSEHARFDGR
ncbi:MAG: arsenate reductase ArsC [Gemmatimonadaceae bacterium]